MYNIQNFSTVAELDSATSMVQKLASEVKRRQRLITRQISNSEENYVSLATEIRKLRNLINGQQALVQENPNDLGFQEALIQSQRELQSLQNKDASYGKNAQQSKTELMALLDGRLAIMEAALVELANRRTEIPA